MKRFAPQADSQLVGGQGPAVTGGAIDTANMSSAPGFDSGLQRSRPTFDERQSRSALIWSLCDRTEAVRSPG